MVIRLLGALTCLAFLVSGAALAEQEAGAQQRPVLDARGGILQTPRGEFTLVPTMCGIHLEDGSHDIEVYGPGTGPDGEAVFFEFSSTGSYMTLGFDVKSVFESAEKQFVAEGFSEQVSEASIFVSDFILYDQDREVVGPGQLIIDCRAE